MQNRGDYIAFDENWRARRVYGTQRIFSQNHIDPFRSLWPIIRPLGARMTFAYMGWMATETVCLVALIVISIFMLSSPFSWLALAFYGLYRGIKISVQFLKAQYFRLLKIPPVRRK